MPILGNIVVVPRFELPFFLFLVVSHCCVSRRKKKPKKNICCHSIDVAIERYNFHSLLLQLHPIHWFFLAPFQPIEFVCVFFFSITLLFHIYRLAMNFISTFSLAVTSCSQEHRKNASRMQQFKPSIFEPKKKNFIHHIMVKLYTTLIEKLYIFFDRCDCQSWKLHGVVIEQTWISWSHFKSQFLFSRISWIRSKSM